MSSLKEFVEAVELRNFLMVIMIVVMMMMIVVVVVC